MNSLPTWRASRYRGEARVFPQAASAPNHLMDDPDVIRDGLAIAIDDALAPPTRRRSRG